MKKVYAGAVWCAVVAIVVAACGGSTEEGGGGGTASGGGAGAVSSGPVAQDQFAQKYADAICNNAATCCQQYGMPFNGAKCSAGFKGDLEEELAEVGKTAGVSYDAARAGECIAMVEKIVKQCVVSEADGAAMQSVCGAVWKGSKAEGEACSSDFECAGAETGTVECNETYVDGGFVGACEKATPAVRGKAGDACSSTCTSTAGGSECSGGGGSGGSTGTPGPAECWVDDGLQCGYPSYTCVELVPEDQPCSFSDLCVTSAWCKNGTCVAKSQVGGECDYATMGSACVAGAYCDQTAKKCAAQVAEGAACTESEQCATGRCEEGKCIPRNAVAGDDICVN